MMEQNANKSGYVTKNADAFSPHTLNVMRKIVFSILIPIFVSPLWGEFEIRDASYKEHPGWKKHVEENEYRRVVIYVSDEVFLDSSDIEDVFVTPSGTSTYNGKTETLYGVAIVFTDAGASKMGSFSKTRIEKPIAVMLDGELLSAPVLMSQVSKQAILTGSSTKQEAEDLRIKLITSRDS